MNKVHRVLKFTKAQKVEEDQEKQVYFWNQEAFSQYIFIKIVLGAFGCWLVSDTFA